MSWASLLAQLSSRVTRVCGEPGHPGPHHQALPVLGDLTAELCEEGGPDRPRSDDRHVAAQHVPELWHLVEVGGAEDAADPGPLFLGPARELLPVVGAEPVFGIGFERAELVHPEELAGTARRGRLGRARGGRSRARSPPPSAPAAARGGSARSRRSRRRARAGRRRPRGDRPRPRGRSAPPSSPRLARSPSGGSDLV